MISSFVYKSTVIDYNFIYVCFQFQIINTDIYVNFACSCSSDSRNVPQILYRVTQLIQNLTKHFNLYYNFCTINNHKINK